MGFRFTGLRRESFSVKRLDDFFQFAILHRVQPSYPLNFAIRRRRSVFFHHHPDLLEAPVDLHLGAAERIPRHGGDVLEAEPLVKAQDQGLPNRHGQPQQVTLETSALLPAVDRVAAGICRIRDFVANCLLRQGLRLAEMIPDHVQAHRVQPGEESLPCPEAPQELKGPQEALLGQVVGVLDASRHAEGQTEDRPLVGIDQNSKGLPVSPEDAADDLCFVDLLHIQIGPAKSHNLLCIFYDKNGHASSLLDDNRRREKLFHRCRPHKPSPCIFNGLIIEIF